MIRSAIIAAVLGTPAAAQSFTAGSSISFALHWSEFNGNNNGVLEPGEGALLSLDVAFTNQNTVATFAPPIGMFGSGTIRGFGGGFLDLIGSANNGGDARGEWNVNQNQGYGVAGDWDVTIGNGNGTPSQMGAALRTLQFGQFSPQGFINTRNPIPEIWRGVWTPAEYSTRTVTFDVASAGITASAGRLVFRLSTNSLADMYVTPPNLVFGSVQIPIVPDPSPLPFLAAAFAGRRRRAGVAT
jgi:hypothetical protein